MELRHRGGAGCRAAILALALVMGGPIILAAQATGAVAGRVVSEVGEPLGGAEITLEPSEGGAARRVESDRTGAFRIGFLAPGSYLLSVRRIGTGSRVTVRRMVAPIPTGTSIGSPGRYPIRLTESR